MIKRFWILLLCLSVSLSACGSGSSSSSSSSQNSGSQSVTTAAATGGSSSSGGACDDFAIAGAKAGAKATQIGIADGATCDDVKALAASRSVLQKAMGFVADGYSCSGVPDPDSGDIDYNCTNGNKGLLFNATGIS